MMEEKVELRCLEGDQELIAGLLPDCERDFIRVFKEQTSHDVKCKININTDHFLDGEGKKV